MKKKFLCLALASLLFLTSCSSTLSSGPSSTATLPPPVASGEAPEDRSGLVRESVLALSLPSLDGEKLLSVVTHLETDAQEDPCTSVIQALLSYPGDDQVRSLSSVPLHLSGRTPVEHSGQVCTVNLDSSAVSLEAEELYILALSLVSTLSQCTDVSVVNLLVNERPLGLDLTDNLPLGSVSAHPGVDLTTLWDQMNARKTPLGTTPADMPLTTSATLYFPLAGKSGLLPEVRSLTFAGQSLPQMARGILTALSSGPQYLTGMAQMPDLSSLLTQAPEVTELAGGGRLLTLYFVPEFISRMEFQNLDPVGLVGSMVMSLTTFLPAVSALRIYSGDTPITSLRSEDAGVMTLENGLLRRRLFQTRILSRARICVTDGARLHNLSITAAQDRIQDPGFLLRTLSQPPLGQEDTWRSAVPDGFMESDLVGIALEGDTILLNLSAHAAALIRRLSFQDQQLCCYALINTFCNAYGMRRLRFFFDSRVESDLGTDLFFGGEFMVNTILLDNHRG